ncbi:MAG TPA: PD-(D/E)XK nuclease family protein [Spirochaetales bacterium]|nr:PD-(D/E)XK nuclease family protein [Spirochaetales bacterium]HRY55945.1 PD-(D/E)XK nuclease family protein [Spirochaetia bacterium]
MDPIPDQVIASLAADRSARFVFPSEICAEAWLRRSLRLGLGGRRALESDRFLGWDRLKEEASAADGRRPADDCLRRIFAARLLADNARRPFLSALIPPQHAASWRPFAAYLASRLPRLGLLPEALAAAGLPGAEGEPEAADWLEARRRYEAFLAEKGRFEPSYEPRSLRLPRGSSVIFYPELIEDFEEYRTALVRGSAEGAAARLVALPAEMPRARLRRPGTALAELRGTLSEIGALLDAGAEASEIAVTVAGLERYRPYLEREAALLSVPIAARSGGSLSASPGGRLFAALRDAYSSGFSYDSLRDLLSSPAWPWKEPGYGRALLEAGRRLHAIAPWPEGGRPVDAWERSLEGQLLRWYGGLKRRVSAIAQAPGFGSLLKAYGAFKGEFLSAEGWDPAADLTLARCVVELEKLAAAQEELGIEVEDAFGIFARGLESARYVEAGSRAGVPVYEWRVAAGSYPERHYLLGASQDALETPARSFDFLGESLRRKLSSALYRDPEAAGRDAAPDFIKAYALSGSRVVFSCPESGWDGDQAVNGLLAQAAEPEPEAAIDPSYREEAAYLAGEGPRPERTHRIQAAGRAAAAEAGSPGSGEGAFLAPAAARAVFDRLTRAASDGRVMRCIDSTAIDYYLACPYAYLYLRLLGAGAEASGIEFADAFFLGDAYHEALALLFARVREEDGSFRPERVGAYRSLLGPCLDEAFARLARQRGAFVRVVLAAYRGRLEAYLANLLEREAERFGALEVGPLEAELELEYPEAAGGVLLRGRIDRISRSARGAVIVDYKKGRLPDKRSVAPDGSGSIAEAQLPCYLRLASASGEELDSAWYLTIEGDGRRAPGSGACAFGDREGAYVPREELDALLKAFDAALERTVEGIAAGSFPFAPKDEQREACRDCGARGICRERYALRFAPAAGAGGRP